jgi:thioredoxin reductase
VEYLKAEQRYVLQANALFVITHAPGSTLINRAGLEVDAKNCIVVNRNQEASIPGVYAAGDIICGGMQISTAVGDGVNAALSAIKYLRSRK